MRKKATFDSNRKARSEAPPPHFLYRVSQPKMSSHLNEDAVKREPFDTAGRLEKDSLLLLVLFLKNSYKKNYFIESLIRFKNNASLAV
jgi:hypothetical protein